MILPTTTLASFILLILALFCWGSWANAQKVVFKWRFELFYYDFALGVTVCAVIAALALGSLNSQELTVSDNLMIASYHKIAYAVGAGAVVSLALLLLLAASSLSGMAVAFPLAFGAGLAVTSLTNYISDTRSAGLTLLLGGLGLLFAALVINVIAYRSHLSAMKEATKLGPVTDPRTQRAVRTPIANRGIVLSILSGIVLGFFFPMVDSSRLGDSGVGPYGLAVLIAIGMFFSTLLFVPFFVNFPVYGDPLQVTDYFKGGKKQHFAGLLAGFVWAIGLVATLVEAAAPPAARPNSAYASGIVQCAPLVAALCGLLAWNEGKGSAQGVKMLLLIATFLYLAGVGFVSFAFSFAAK
jgi:glucose uptake protein